MIKNDLIVYDLNFSLEYEEYTNIFGNVQNNLNQNNNGMTLNEALLALFKHHQAGILIASSKSLGVMHYNEKFYFTDSHSCGPKGASARPDLGRACIIECDTLVELERIIRRSTGSKNKLFTLSYIDVNMNNAISVDMVNEESYIDVNMNKAISVNTVNEENNGYLIHSNEQFHTQNSIEQQQFNQTVEQQQRLGNAYMQINNVASIVPVSYTHLKA